MLTYENLPQADKYTHFVEAAENYVQKLLTRSLLIDADMAQDIVGLLQAADVIFVERESELGQATVADRDLFMKVSEPGKIYVAKEYITGIIDAYGREGMEQGATIVMDLILRNVFRSYGKKQEFALTDDLIAKLNRLFSCEIEGIKVDRAPERTREAFLQKVKEDTGLDLSHYTGLKIVENGFSITVESDQGLLIPEKAISIINTETNEEVRQTILYMLFGFNKQPRNSEIGEDYPDLKDLLLVFNIYEYLMMLNNVARHGKEGEYKAEFSAIYMLASMFAIEIEERAAIRLNQDLTLQWFLTKIHETWVGYANDPTGSEVKLSLQSLDSAVTRLLNYCVNKNLTQLHEDPALKKASIVSAAYLG